MAISTVADLVLELKKHPLLESSQLDDVTRHAPARFKEPQALTQELLRRGWLTQYQVKLLLSGQGQHLLLGSFLLLDRIGEGGMGQVFKAQHQGLLRTVALKVLRRELVHDVDAVGRFYREIKVVSQLPPHPNLVKAVDAGPIGATHFLAMEYVEGIDLQRLVKEKGPMTVARACDCVCQAALGLQHAHAHGLVHRDIKPANLLLATGPQPVLKILDLGLARLQATGKGNAREDTLLTSDGPMTMGTVDYQAPEQALDFHKADIRADIYSLGCTFYYLLTGKPPFGSGPLAIKLMRHQQAEPPDLKQRRPEAPDALLPIVRRMLAKRPDERFQTPDALADALAPFVSSQGHASKPTERVRLFGTVAGKGRIRLFVGLGAVLIVAGLVLSLSLALSGTSTIKGSEHSENSSLPGPSNPQNPNPSTAKGSALQEPIAWVSTGKAYEVIPAKVGAILYIDRTYKIIALSPALDGGLLIRSSNVDRNIGAAEHLKLTLLGPADIYVAFDSRATGIPAWLNDSWQRTTETFRSTDGSGELSRNVFLKRFASGPVTLGGNSQKPSAAAGTHYVVIIRPASAQP